MINKYTIIKSFINEKFPHLILDHWADEQIRIDYPPGFNNSALFPSNSLVSVYPKTIYYICDMAQEGKFDISLELGVRWNDMWNKVSCSISDLAFFANLEKATALALKNYEINRGKPRGER